MWSSLATRANLDLLDENYRRWRQNPESVYSGWAAFFEGFELGELPERDGAVARAAEGGEGSLQSRVDGLVYAYRTLGHTIARLDPLADRRRENPLLTLRELGFSEKDLDLHVSSKFFFGNRQMTLREMIAALENIYAGSIGSEFMHIQNTRVRNWMLHGLESVDPVVEGTARARQRIRNDTDHRRKVLPLLIHGDAAFAGQGIVAETLNMSQLPGYSTGGTVHIVVNNQIGFTTLPEDARSSMYATDIAKMIEAPIFHVNGDDPLAVKFVTEMALDFRQEFGRDVVIDMYCYRKHGHQEIDEPSFTQPDLYARIEKRPSVAQLYKRQLLEAGTLSQDDVVSLETEFQLRLEMPLDNVKALEKEKGDHQAKFKESTAVFQPEYTSSSEPTAISGEMLKIIVDGLTRVPADFNIQPKIKRIVLDHQRKVFKAGGPYQWHYAEALAFGSLLLEGIPLRLSGQDSSRGTFSTRHAVLYDAKTGEPYIPLMHLAQEQARICIYNSLLSEAAVLGFDYGYSLDYPDMLCLWEAQFGDFANGAQTIIDQFIVSAESKWQRPSGIVLLLPHGYEGQGPEHSSARLERFLQACAEDNIQVCNLTTAAQYFHVLRRQMKRKFVKPLIIMTPKSLLRADFASSRAEEFTSGGFEEILGSLKVGPAEKMERVILCSGKVYYDLLNYREAQKIDNAAIIRIEQLYPLAEKKLRANIKPYPKTAKLVWCQEESQNMGAWSFIEPRLRQLFGRDVAYAGRSASASPAVGALATHKREQACLIAEAFNV